MMILINIIKIVVVFFITKLIIEFFETQDTSAFYQLIVKKTEYLYKKFSPHRITELQVCFKKLSIPFNIFTVAIIVGVGIIAFISVFMVTKMFFKLESVRYILSIPFLFTGMIILKVMAERKQEKLEAGLSDFFIQLKSALKVNPDIIEALRRIQNNVLDPFSAYTKQLLNEINAGKLPEIALENFAHKVDIEKFSFYINNLRYCHIYGGDITLLTEKTQEVIKEAINQKKKRNKETKSACMVLYILIIIDFYMYFMFINSNEYYLSLVNETLIGQMIVNINFICIWVMVWLSRAIKKLDY